MSFQLRYYQEDAVNAVFTYFMSHTGNPIIAMPTGTGKSIVIAELARRILCMYPNQRIQIITHVKTLIEQNFNKLLIHWPTAPAGIHSAGLKRRDCMQPIIFGGVQSMHRRAADFGRIDLLFVDEGHLIPPNSETMYQRYINALKKTNPLLKVIGLTATPWRLKGGHLTEGPTFDDVIYDNTRLKDFNRLIDEGYLAPVVPKKPILEINATGLHTRAGEFIPAEVEERVGYAITEQALRETVQEGADRKHWLVFAVSIAHAETIVEILTRLNVRAVAYHSKMPPKEADQALADFTAGKYRAIVSRDRLTTGIDIPQIDLIVMLRLTRSPGLWVQMLGRGTRPFPGKRDCLVLDFAGNTRRLGPINDPMLPQKKNCSNSNGGTHQAPVKACPTCLIWQPSGTRICEYCGFEFPYYMTIAPSASTEKLIRKESEPPRLLHVDHITYKRHHKEGRPDSLRVTYFCGLTRVQEFVCPDHSKYLRSRAQHWWRQRSPLDFPESLNGMIPMLNHLATPTHALVDFNDRYPEIKKVEFN